MLSNVFKAAFLTFATFAAAAPSAIFSRSEGNSAAAVLLQIAPKSISCTGADFPEECATNTDAAPFLISAMGRYRITSPSEIAAILSLIAFETADFKYNINHFPGRAGQGTRALLMPNFVFLYVKSIPALSSALGEITPASTIEGLSDEQLNAIRALVLPDEYTWGAATWFLTSQCASARPAIQAGGQAGFEAYMSCIGTPTTPDRLAYWTRANAALGIS